MGTIWRFLHNSPQSLTVLRLSQNRSVLHTHLSWANMGAIPRGKTLILPPQIGTWIKTNVSISTRSRGAITLLHPPEVKIGNHVMDTIVPAWCVRLLEHAMNALDTLPEGAYHVFSLPNIDFLMFIKGHDLHYSKAFAVPMVFLLGNPPYNICRGKQRNSNPKVFVFADVKEMLRLFGEMLLSREQAYIICSSLQFRPRHRVPLKDL